jgi:hypothetical protein
LLYPRNFGEGRWGISWMLLHRNRVHIGCEGCLIQTRCTRFQALLITISRIYRKQAWKASQQSYTDCLDQRQDRECALSGVRGFIRQNLEGINLLVEKGTHVLRTVKNVIFSILVFCITNFLLLLRHSKHEAHHKQQSTEMLSI